MFSKLTSQKLMSVKFISKFALKYIIDNGQKQLVTYISKNSYSKKAERLRKFMKTTSESLFDKRTPSLAVFKICPYLREYCFIDYPSVCICKKLSISLFANEKEIHKGITNIDYKKFAKSG